MSIRAGVALSVVLLLATAAMAATAPAELPEIAPGSDEDWRDLALSIQNLGSQPTGAQLLRLAGSHHGSPVAFEVLLDPSWERAGQTAGISLVMSSGSVRIRSTGAQSDHFLVVLDDLYGTRQHPRKMRPETEFAAIALQGDPTQLKAGPVKLKLFFESEDESRYAELFLNIDAGARTAELAEKDPDYRAAIIRALRAQ